MDTLGSWWSVLYTVEHPYCGHLGECPVYSGTPLLWTPWGPVVKHPVYSGTSLLWTPWVPGRASCIQWNFSIIQHREVSSFHSIFWGYTSKEFLIQRCPYFRVVLLGGVPLYSNFSRGARNYTTVEPPRRGRFGEMALSLVERLSLSRRFLFFFITSP